MITFEKEKDYLICVDSDGTVMDSMVIKHTKALAPKLISVFGLENDKNQILKKWYELNLYKETRGLNRFIALDSILAYAGSLDYSFEGYDIYHNWVINTQSLSVPSLKNEIERRGNYDCLAKALKWGEDVNLAIERLPLAKPFKNARRSLEILSERVDLLGVSSANEKAILAEWKSAKIDYLFKAIGCQKDGTKEKIIEFALSLGYKNDHVLMLGDSMGDFLASRRNNILFFPFIPYHENDSWNRLINEAFPLFL